MTKEKPYETASVDEDFWGDEVTEAAEAFWGEKIADSENSGKEPKKTLEVKDLERVSIFDG